MGKMSAIAIALMVAVAYGSADAAVFVVDPTPPACSNPSGAVHVPTIGAAVTAAVAGDRIYVCPGTYPENVVVAPTQSNLTLLGIDRPLVVPGDPSQPGFMILASGVRVQGFEVAGFADGPFNCGIAVGDPSGQLPTPPSGVIVIANVVHDNNWGVCFLNAGGNEARDNTADRNVAGIADAAFPGVIAPNLVIGNRARGNSLVGIGALGGANPRVDMNEASENLLGIGLAEGAGGVISRNTVLKNQTYGIGVDGACCVELDHNTVRENVLIGIYVDGTDGTFGCSVDENSVARNGEGIRLEHSANCQVYRNVVQQNATIGINARSLGSGDIFTFNSASGNRVLDCKWDGSDAPTFASNRCLTESPAGAWD